MTRDPKMESGPPGLFRLVLKAALHPRDRAYAIADMDEEFGERCRSDGKRHARWWYRTQVVRSLLPALQGRFVRRHEAIPVVPVRSYLAMISDFFTDIRMSARGLAKTPLVLIVTVLSLGTGIGAVTVTLAVLNEVLVAPPVGLEAPDRLVTVYRSRSDGELYGRSSYLDYLDVVRDLPALDGITAIRMLTVSMDGPGQPVPLLAEVVSANFFDVSGIRPIAGRAFTEHESDDSSAPRVAVLGYDTWQRAFAGNPEALGSSVRLNGRMFTIIGVGPEGVRSRGLPLSTDIWIPLGSLEADGIISEEHRSDRSNTAFVLFGRLSPGATREAAQAQADVLASRLYSEYPEAWTDDRSGSHVFSVLGEAESRVNPRARALFAGVGIFFVGTAGLILLLACANVAGLVLSGARRRRTEFAVRISLGANRGRIVRMMLTEGLLPGLASGALGMAIAVFVTQKISSASLPVAIPIRLDAEVTPGVLALTLGLAMAVSIAFSLLPALKASRPDLLSTLKDGSGGAVGSRPSRRYVKHGLVVIQCATSIILLVGATLFIRTLGLATQLDLGFNPARVAVATKRLDRAVVGPQEGVQYIRDLRERLASQPGVEQVAMASSLELTLFQTITGSEITVSGRENAAEPDPDVFHNAVTAGYLEMLEITLMSGRSLQESDTEDSSPVAVINESFADRYWAGEDPLGRTFFLKNGDRTRSFEVIGVTRDGKYQDFDDPPNPYFWTSIYQDYTPHFGVAIKGSQSAEAMLPVLRTGIELSEGEVQRVAPTTLESQISIKFVHLRIASTVLGWGGLFGLFLAAIGIYGVVSLAVTQRSREIAIRLALGADGGEVLRSVAFDGLKPAAMGLILGVAIVIPTANLARVILYGVSPMDQLAIGAGVGLLLFVAACASMIPARRVTRIDPMGTLRAE